MPEQDTVSRLYRRLLKLYPRAFRERLGKSMQQTFHDLYNERHQKNKLRVFSFVLWIFLDTSVAIIRERIQVIEKADFLHITLKKLASSACLSFLMILPLMTMQFVNRRHLNEEFPFMLFFSLWLCPFATSLWSLPIARAWWTRNHDVTNHVVTQRRTFYTNPRSTSLISILLILFNIIAIALRNELEPLIRSMSGPSIEVAYLLFQVIIAGLSVILPLTAGIIAGGPIINTLRAGGSLLAHPINLTIVIALSLLIILLSCFLLVDQWPCFLGVPNCD